MMMRQLQQWTHTNAALTSILWQHHLRLSSIRLLLVLGGPAETRFVFTHQQVSPYALWTTICMGN
jgi:hypothetical protein